MAKNVGKVFMWNQMHPKVLGLNVEVKDVCHCHWVIILFY